MKKNSLTLVYVLLVASVAIWGATWISGRMLARSMGPFSAAFLRFVSASIFLFILVCREEKRLPRLAPRDLLGTALLGFFGVALYNFLFFSGLKTVTAGRAALMIACTPAVMALFAALFQGERLGRLRICGILTSFLGASVILSGGNPLGLFLHGVRPGDAFILGCVGSWAAYSLLGGMVMRRMTPLSAVAWSCFLGTLMLLPPAVMNGVWEDALRAGPVDWGNIIFLGTIATGLAFTWYYKGIQVLGSSRAGVFLNLVPVFALILGHLILDEPLGISLATGGVLVLFGVWLTNRRPAG
ncbi:MAG: DMT family transporter [Desulfovibrio aminophilus]|uniref:DMT family transporter n=1 Tax=Desulfovibrio aminophilus TaxID=81425 RepID=UPI002A42E77E|nr:DMT family transporter [Desulfovibrionaceae bacterium]